MPPTLSVPLSLLPLLPLSLIQSVRVAHEIAIACLRLVKCQKAKHSQHLAQCGDMWVRVAACESVFECIGVCVCVFECVYVCVLLYYVCVFEQISLHFETFARLTKNLAAATAALWADANSRGTLWSPSLSLSHPPSLCLFSSPTNWNCLCAFGKLWSRRRNLIESAWKCQASYDLPLPLPPHGVNKFA